MMLILKKGKEWIYNSYLTLFAVTASIDLLNNWHEWTGYFFKEEVLLNKFIFQKSVNLRLIFKVFYK